MAPRSAESYRGARRNNVLRAHGIAWPAPAGNRYASDSSVAPRQQRHRGISVRLTGTKSYPYRHIIHTEKVGSRTYELHATKGWRCYRNKAVAL